MYDIDERRSEAELLIPTWFEEDVVARLIVDHDFNVLSCNRAARELIETCGALGIADGKFSLLDEQQNAELQRYLLENDQQSPRILVLRRGDEAHLVVRPQFFQRDGRAAIGLTLALLGSFESGAMSSFASQLGLTPAEARVLGPLLEGRSGKKIAHALGRSTETVRSHISNIYRKTGVNSRLDLLRLAALHFR